MISIFFPFGSLKKFQYIIPATIRTPIPMKTQMIGENLKNRRIIQKDPDKAIETIHAVLFHLKIFFPSKTETGNKLNTAIMALSWASITRNGILDSEPGKAIVYGTRGTKRRQIPIKKKLVIGPAKEILPFFSRVIFAPAIITAPGPTSLNGESIETIVRTTPKGISLNSPQ